MAYLRILLGLAISAVCVVALLTQIDLQLTWAALTRAQPLWIVAAILVLIAAMVTKAYRWGYLYYPTTGLRLNNLFAALAIGYMVLSVVPMRLGELVRAYLIGRKEPVAFTQSVGTVLVEKVLDVLTILAFLAVFAPFLPVADLGVPSWVLVAMGLGGIGGLAALAWLPRRHIVHILARLQLYLPGSRRFNLVKIVGPFLDAVAILRYPRLLPTLVIWSLINWSMAAAINYLSLMALGIDVPFTAAIWLMVVTNLVMILPSAPGYVGVFHKFSVIALGAYAVDPNAAAAYAIVSHALVYGTFIVVGLIFVWRGGYRWSDLWPRGSSEPAAEAYPVDPAPRTEPVRVEASPLVTASSPPERLR